jgi:nucleoside-diphosphate-sugar epimerase
MHENVLIMGGAGKVGRKAAERFTEEGCDVTLFDRVMPDEERRPWKTDLPCIRGDITSFEDCMRGINLAGADLVILTAAIVGTSERQPGRVGKQRRPEDATMRVNLMGTYYVLEACRRLGVGKLLFASTNYVLAHAERISGTPFVPEYLPIDEEHPVRPEASYGLSKLLDEQMLAAYSRAYGMRTAAFRLSWVHDPVIDDYDYPFPLGLDEPRPGCPGTYSYVDSRDIAEAFLLAAEVGDGVEPHEVYYLLTDTFIGEDVPEVIEKYFPDCHPWLDRLEPGKDLISIDKIRRKLGYEPKHSWRRGAGGQVEQ